MVGWFSTNHAVCSGNNRQLCCRYLLSSDYPRFGNLNLGSVKIKLISLLFCMRLISLHCQKNCVWTSLKCHTSPTSNQCGVRLSSKRPSRVIWWRKICPYSATIISWIRGFCHGFSSLIFFDDYILLSAAKISSCNFLSVLLTFCVVPIG